MPTKIKGRQSALRDGPVIILIGNGSTVIPTGIWTFFEVPYSGTIKSWTCLSKPAESGTIVIDLWKKAYADWASITSSDTIIGNSNKPRLTSGNKLRGTDLTSGGDNWATIAVTKGDLILVNVDSVTTVTLVSLTLNIEKTS